MIKTILIFSLIFSSAHGSTNDSEIKLPGGTFTLSSKAFPATLTIPKGLSIVQFYNDLHTDDLYGSGLILLQYLGQNAYWVFLKDDLDLHSHAWVKSYGKPEPVLKIHASLQHYFDAVPEGKKVVTVCFRNGISSSRATQIVTAAGANSLYSRMWMGNRVVILADYQAIKSIAASDSVLTIDNTPEKKKPFNLKAAKLSGIDIVQKDFGLTGKGVNVGLWDASVMAYHREFKDRLHWMDDNWGDLHSTHVGGTIGAAGIKKKAEGMAPECELYSYDFQGDVAREMMVAKRRYDVVISNNSWGYVLGWDGTCNNWIWFGDELFGAYDNNSMVLDFVIHKSGIIICFAAGNDRTDTGPQIGQPYRIFGKSKIFIAKEYKPDGPYNSIGPLASSKNVITVGAVGDGAKMSDFSSWGPVKDGRVKPEVVAKGVHLLSCAPLNSYSFFDGTSMSTPVVSGGLALVAEQWRKLYDEDIHPAIVRGLIAACSDDLGNKGPDYSFGYGLFNVEEIIKVINQNTDHNTVILDKVKKKMGTREAVYKLSVPAGCQQVKVALAWIDYPAAVDSEITLVNDLDLTIIDPAGEKVFPWILDAKNPEAPATNGVNNRDNIELITLTNPQAGDYTVEVKASNFGWGSSQKFALIVNATNSVSLAR